MCGLKAAQIHERPCRAAKDYVQPLATLDSYLPYGRKDLISSQCYHPCASGVPTSCYRFVVMVINTGSGHIMEWSCIT